MKTYKFKLYRSKRNKYLDKLLSTACDIYNFSLSYKKNLYTNDKISISKYDLQKVLTQLKDTDGYQYWSELGSQVIQDITDRIYKGYNLFFLNLKNKGSRKVFPPKFKKKRFGKKISDLGFGDFVKKLEYLCLKYSKNLVKISRWYPSSKRCNNCGNINKELKLKDRSWQCVECKVFHDRDINAAKNILEEGKKFIVRALTIKVDTVIPNES